MLTKWRNSSGVSTKNALLPDADLCRGMLSSASPTWLLVCSCTSPLCPEWQNKTKQKNNFKCRKLLIMILPSFNHNTTEFLLIAARVSHYQKTIWKLTTTALLLRPSATRQGNCFEKKKTTGGLGTSPPPPPFQNICNLRLSWGKFFCFVFEIGNSGITKLRANMILPSSHPHKLSVSLPAQKQKEVIKKGMISIWNLNRIQKSMENNQAHMAT